MKLVTSPMEIRRSPSADIRLTARISSPLVSGRMSCTERSSHEARPLKRTIPAAKIANSVTGWGSRFPSFSTMLRKVAKRPRRLGSASAGLEEVGSLM